MARLFPFIGAVFLLMAGAVPGQAQWTERQTLGNTRLFTNDAIADRRDRWRSGGYGVSVIRGREWDGDLPTGFGRIIEYRFRGEVMAPDNLRAPAPGDRLYAGTWWLGAHSHFDWSGFDVTAGADIAITGEQSRIRAFQSGVHDLLSMPRMDVENYQVDDGVHLHATLEIARGIDFPTGEFRPFLELQVGAETMARAGIDVTFGSFGQGGLRVRDPITGHRVAGIVQDEASGWSFLLGADVAYVESSVFLPAHRGFEVEDTRTRIRAGVNFGFGASNIFYGVTYMSEEFVGQPEGQLVGSLSLGLQF